jgi:hypothetical protein
MVPSEQTEPQFCVNRATLDPRTPFLPSKPKVPVGKRMTGAAFQVAFELLGQR